MAREAKTMSDIPENWGPAVKALTPEFPSLLDYAMYMGTWQGRYHYKHEMSRNYLYLDEAGRAYDGAGRRISRAAAIAHFAGGDYL